MVMGPTDDEMLNAELAKRQVVESRVGNRIDNALYRGHLEIAEEELTKLAKENRELREDLKSANYTIGKLQTRLGKVLAGRFRLEAKLQGMAERLRK